MSSQSGRFGDRIDTGIDVVVTGMGATTPLGGDVSSTWAGLLAGKSGVSRYHEDWIEQLPAKIVASLAVDPADVLTRVEMRRLDRCQQVGVVAAREAWAHSGLADSGLDPERLGVAVGTGIGGALTLLGQDDLLEASGPRKVSPLTVPMLMPNGPAAWIGLDVGAQAFVRAPVSACASGSDAIALALDQIRLGRADVVVAGGAEACVHPLPLAGFARMGALSTRNDEPEKASRPFDKDRDGFVLGEGAGILILERADHAAARGATVYARLVGAGVTSDSHHIAATEPTGAGASRAIAMALADGGLTPADIGHVNAHATSTPVGDPSEASAIRSAIGPHPLVTATKSMTGHMLGAAGAVESIVTILSLRDQIVPATANLDQIDEGIDLDIATVGPREHRFEAALNNSFGFGGHNAALVFTRP